MTNEEWKSKTDDWRKGWRYGQGDVFVEPRNTDDFKAGYQYALANPFGACYTVSATTGK